MLTRWILRGLVIALLTLCVAAWVRSDWKQLAIHYESGQRTFDATLFYGEIYFDQSYNEMWHLVPSWTWHKNLVNRGMMDDAYSATNYRFLGFGYQPWWTIKHLNDRWVMAPMWFPTLLSALLLRFVWRKTRPKSTAKGFPVEPAAQPIKP